MKMQVFFTLTRKKREQVEGCVLLHFGHVLDLVFTFPGKQNGKMRQNMIFIHKRSRGTWG